MRDVKEEEVVNRITKMAAKLHFSGDRSSILGMKVSADVTNWGTWMTTKRSWPPSLPRWTKTFSIPYKQNKLLLLYSCVLFNNQSCEHMFGHSPIKFFGLEFDYSGHQAQCVAVATNRADNSQSLPFLSTFCIFKHIVIWQFVYFFKSLPEISHLPNFCLCVLLVDSAVDGEKNLEKKTREVADIGVYQFSWNFLQRGCDTTMNSLTSLVFFSRLFSPSKVSSTTNSHVLNVVTYVGNMKKKKTVRHLEQAIYE